MLGTSNTDYSLNSCISICRQLRGGIRKVSSNYSYDEVQVITTTK